MSDRDICHNPCPGGFCRIPCDDNFGCSPVTVTFWSLSRFWREGPESVTDLGILMSSISFLYMLSAPSAVCHPLVKLKTNLESNKSFENQFHLSNLLSWFAPARSLKYYLQRRSSSFRVANLRVSRSDLDLNQSGQSVILWKGDLVIILTTRIQQ